MTTIGLDILTNTRINTFKACRERERLRYRCGITRDRDQKALRFGTVFHKALECLADTGDIDAACELVRDCYDVTPAYIDSFDWAIERETVLRLVCGYAWRWADDQIEYVASEWEFDVPIINPASGRPSRTFRRRGKIDGIIRREGHKALKETKTTSDSIAPDSDYWPRLAIDSQIIGYVDAAREHHPDVDAVLYDVIRKPGIEPKQVPILDDFGMKIVLDTHGERVHLKNGLPRQSADKAEGHVLQTRREAPQEFGDRLTADIGERPDFYYARRMLPISEAALASYRAELWSVANDIRAGECYRNTSACLHPYPCEFTAVCFNQIEVTADGDVPDGFVRMENVHPELNERENHVNDTNCTAACPAALADTAAGE